MTFDTFIMTFKADGVEEVTLDISEYGSAKAVFEALNENYVTKENHGYISSVIVDYYIIDYFDSDWNMDIEKAITAIFNSDILYDDFHYGLFMAMGEILSVDFAFMVLIENTDSWSDDIYYYPDMTLVEVAEMLYDGDDEVKRDIDENYKGDIEYYASFMPYDGYYESNNYGSYLYNK